MPCLRVRFFRFPPPDLIIAEPAMQCPSCGEEVADQLERCVSCGAQLALAANTSEIAAVTISSMLTAESAAPIKGSAASNAASPTNTATASSAAPNSHHRRRSDRQTGPLAVGQTFGRYQI